MLDKECGDKNKLGTVAELMIDLVDLAFVYPEIGTYLILFGRKFDHISDSRRQFLIRSIDEASKIKFTHRSIISNILLTERYCETELTFFDPRIDFEQMWNIQRIDRSISKTISMKYDDDYDRISRRDYSLAEFTGDELKKIYDCWACLMLDTSDDDFKDFILNKIDDIIDSVRWYLSGETDIVSQQSLIRQFDKPFPPTRSQVEHEFKVILEGFRVEHCTDEEIETATCTINNGDEEILFTGIGYTFGYLWLWGLKEHLKRLSVSLDNIDFLEYIHILYNIERYNYNKTEDDNLEAYYG